MILQSDFFNQFPVQLARALLGKVLRHRYHDPDSGQSMWLAARIIETEAYYRTERASHSSLGYTAKRKAMFMQPGTIYMYYARGHDSLNFSARGRGNAVLVKSAVPFTDDRSPGETLVTMQKLNPRVSAGTGLRDKDPMPVQPRAVARLCSGQTLLCRSLGLTVPVWDQQQLNPRRFYLEDLGYSPDQVIQCKRLGIARERDAHLPFRFIDSSFRSSCSSDPLRKKNAVCGLDYSVSPARVSY